MWQISSNQVDQHRRSADLRVKKAVELQGGCHMFGFDWTGDGKEDAVDDLLTMELFGMLDPDDKSDSDNLLEDEEEDEE